MTTRNVKLREVQSNSCEHHNHAALSSSCLEPSWSYVSVSVLSNEISKFKQHSLEYPGKVRASLKSVIKLCQSATTVETLMRISSRLGCFMVCWKNPQSLIRVVRPKMTQLPYKYIAINKSGLIDGPWLLWDRGLLLIRWFSQVGIQIDFRTTVWTPTLHPNFALQSPLNFAS